MLPRADSSRRGSGRQSRPRQRQPPRSPDSASSRELDSPNQAARAISSSSEAQRQDGPTQSRQEFESLRQDTDVAVASTSYQTPSERRGSIPMKSTASHLSPRKSIKRLTTRPPTIRNRAPSSGVLTTDTSDDDEPTTPFAVEQGPSTSGTQHHGLAYKGQPISTQDSPSSRFSSPTAGTSSSLDPLPDSPPIPPRDPVIRFGTSSFGPPREKGGELPPIPLQAPVFTIVSETPKATSPVGPPPISHPAPVFTFGSVTTKAKSPVGPPPISHPAPVFTFGSVTTKAKSPVGLPPIPQPAPVFTCGSVTTKTTSPIGPLPIPLQAPVFRFGGETTKTINPIGPPGRRRGKILPILPRAPVFIFGSGTGEPTSSIETGAVRSIPVEQMMDTDPRPSELSICVPQEFKEQPPIPQQDSVFRFSSETAETITPIGLSIPPVFRFGSGTAGPTSSVDGRLIPDEQMMDTEMRSSELSPRASISNVSMRDAFEEAPPEGVSQEFLAPHTSILPLLSEMTPSNYQMDTTTPPQRLSETDLGIRWNAPTSTFGNYVRFTPVFDEDYLEENDMVHTVPTRIQCITAMVHYANRSFEELRWDDYQNDRIERATVSEDLSGQLPSRETFYSYEPSLAPLFESTSFEGRTSSPSVVEAQQQPQIPTPTPPQSDQSDSTSTGPAPPQFDDSFFSDPTASPPAKPIELSRSSSYTAFARMITKKCWSFFNSQQIEPCAQESQTRITHDSVSFPPPRNLSQFLYLPSTSRASRPSFLSRPPITLDVSREMSLLLKSAAERLRRTRPTFLQEQPRSLVDELVDFRLDYTSRRRLRITRRPEPRYDVHPIGKETPDGGPNLVPIFDKEVPPTPTPSVATLILDPLTEAEKARDRLCQKLSEFSDDEESIPELKHSDSESSSSSSSARTVCFIPSNLSTIPEEDEDAYASTATPSVESIAIEERSTPPLNVIRVSSTDLLITPEQCEELNKIRLATIAEGEESESDTSPRVIDVAVGDNRVSSTSDIGEDEEQNDESKEVRVLFQSRLCHDEPVASTSGTATQEWVDDSSEESSDDD